MFTSPLCFYLVFSTQICYSDYNMYKTRSYAWFKKYRTYKIYKIYIIYISTTKWARLAKRSSNDKWRITTCDMLMTYNMEHFCLYTEDIMCVISVKQIKGSSIVEKLSLWRRHIRAFSVRNINFLTLSPIFDVSCEAILQGNWKAMPRG